MYPEHLLPKANYHIIRSKHFAENEDLVLIRHIESSKVKYMEGTSTLHPDCIKFQNDQLRDLSTNLLGIFTCADISKNYVLYGMKGVMLEKYSQRNFSKMKVGKLSLYLYT